MRKIRFAPFKTVSVCLILILSCGISISTSARQDQVQDQAKDAEFQQTFDYATKLLNRGDYDNAIKQLEKAAKVRDGKCAECFRVIGQTHVAQRKYKDAAVAFRHAIDLNQGNEADIQLELGTALYFGDDKKRMPEAEKSFQRAIELNTSHKEIAYYYLGSVLIRLGNEKEGIDALKESVRLKPDSRWASAARATIANPKMSKETIAMDFKATSTTGEEITLEKYRGKIILLDFWATWCGPCRAELPNIKEIWKKHGSDQFVIIGVSLDSNQKAFNDYVSKEGLTWPQYFDGRGWSNKIARLYHVRAIPAQIVIDQDGAVHSVGLRGGRLTSDIDGLLKKLHKSQKS